MIAYLVSALGGFTHELRVFFSIAADDEKGRQCIILSEKLKERLGLPRMRAVVEGKSYSFFLAVLERSFKLPKE